MINTSREYQERIRKDRIFYARVDIRLADGTTIRVRHDEEASDIMQGGFKIADGTSGSGSFDIGAAVINQLTLRLNNADEKYSQYDFTGAELRPKVGLRLSKTVEWMSRGVFEVDEAAALDNTINITALDHMEKFDRPYSGSTLPYPATFGEIVRDACAKCGVVLATQTFDRKDYVVEKRPEAEATFRDVLSWAAQIAGCYCRCDADGRLELKWYDLSAFGDDGQGLDGGHFDRLDSSRYRSGDTADGGRFRPWDAGDAYDAGGFGTMGGYHHIYALTGKDVCADDVVVTGVRVAADEGSEYQAGSDGYVLSIEKNLLIAAGKEKEAAEYLAGKLAGLRFRPLSVKAVSDPSAEAGDIAIVSDRKGNRYRTILTNLEFSLGEAETYTCDAQTPSRRQATRYSESTKAIVAARKETAGQIGAYDLAVQDMVSLMANSMGMFETIEETENGGRIVYQHDKPTLKESMKIWKKSEQGFMVSQDGGKTWTAGMDTSGNAVLNVLNVIGINANWINTGTMSASKINGGVLMLGGANNENGELYILNASRKIIGKWNNEGLKAIGDIELEKIVNAYQAGVTKNRTYRVNIGEFNFIDPTYEQNQKRAGLKTSVDGEDGIAIAEIQNSSAILPAGNRPISIYAPRDEDTGGRLQLLMGHGKHTVGYPNFGSFIWWKNGSGSPLLSFNLGASGTPQVDMSEANSVLFRGDSGYGVYIYAQNQSTSGQEARFVGAGSNNYRLYRGTSSSKKYKNSIRHMTEADIENLYQIQPVMAKFNLDILDKSDERYDIIHPMFIAENIDRYFPEAVDHNSDGSPENWNQKVMIPAMFQMIKSQKNLIKSLESRIERLENIIKERQYGDTE